MFEKIILKKRKTIAKLQGRPNRQYFVISIRMGGGGGGDALLF